MIYSIAFDGLVIEIEYSVDEVRALLAFLFDDMQPGPAEAYLCVARFTFSRDARGWSLLEQGGGLAAQKAQIMDLALILLNVSMERFAAQNHHSIALHAGLVSDSEGGLLLAGRSGVGKSNACLWLSHMGMHYHTDEMVMINRDTRAMQAFTRPYTLKRPVVETVEEKIIEPLRKQSLDDQDMRVKMRVSVQNFWLAHRLVNPDYLRAIPPLKAVVFPVYSSTQDKGLTKISGARAAMELMHGQFQGQHFDDHGFAFFAALLRNLPAYIVVYHDFDRLIEQLAPLTKSLSASVD